MTLVDTSVWVEHLRKSSPELSNLLNRAMVLVHPFVVGELACGNLSNRTRILMDLKALASAVPATHEEVMGLVLDRKLYGIGIGWLDAHLLASTLLSNCDLWTLDKRLLRAARTAGVVLHRSL